MTAKVKRNPKQIGTCLFDCIPQVGPCPMNCNQCFYNRPNAFYTDIKKPLIPEPETVGDGIVRMNSGNDSCVEKQKVIEVAKRYKNYFFNTSVNDMDFPGPVVLTVNRDEERTPARSPVIYAPAAVPANLMFVRVKVSISNIGEIVPLICDWTLADVPVVLTFMRYYEVDALNYTIKHRNPFVATSVNGDFYEFKKHIINRYWCMTKETKLAIMKLLEVGKNRLLTTCGTPDSSLCKDCRNCEHYYWITKRRMYDKEEL